MAISREDIQRRFQSDMEAAEAWKDADPARYAQEREKAYDRRADAQDALTTAAEQSARSASLATAKAAALVKYPLAAAMESLITGDTPEAIEAAAKTIHDSVSKSNENALKEANLARRPLTRAAWTGSPTGARPGVPGGEITQPDSAMTQMVDRTYNRTAEIIREAGKPGTLRRYSDEATEVLRSPDPEAQALADHQVLTPNTGLSQRAMKARSEGKSVFTGETSDEDRRG